MSEEFDKETNGTANEESSAETGYTEDTTVENTTVENTEYAYTDSMENTESEDTNNTEYTDTDSVGNTESESTDNQDGYNGYSTGSGYYSDNQTGNNNNTNQKVYDKHEARADKRLQKQRAKAERLNKKHEMKKNKGGSGFGSKFVKFICAAVIFGIIAGAVAMAFGYGYDYFKSKDGRKIQKTPVVAANNEPESESETEKESQKDVLKDEETKSSDSGNTSNGSVIITDVSEVVDNVMPSVVAITSTEIVNKASTDDFWSYFYGDQGDSQQYESQGAGSGIIIGENDTELLIVTNKHVVADADTLSVQFVDGKSVDAKIKSQNEKQDLAIVSIPLNKIDSDTMDNIKIATIGESDNMKVGEGCIAIGNALGYGQSVTTGVISALDRTINVDNIERKVIQTDAAINPGNSGGALLNMKGEVIGINSAKSVDQYTEGMGYAVPMSNVKELLGNMMTQETRDKVDDKDKGYLNIYGKDVTEELSQMYDIPEGVYVIEVIEGGAAQKAGINKYDVITGVDGDSVTGMTELQEKLAYYKKGEKVKITIQTLKDKEYTEKEVEVQLAAQKE